METKEPLEKKIGTETKEPLEEKIGSESEDNSLARTPSMPSYHEGRESEDPENEFALSTLIRQASLTSSDVFINSRPRNPRKKAMKKSYSAPRGNNPEEKKSMQTENQVDRKQQPNLRKSMSNLETQVMGLRRREMAAFEDGQASSSSSQVPKWPDKASSVEDMKAQIKFWARSVAANANGR